ncbi:MAG: hypothetical protein ICV78_13665 [Tolypothrix sp. Co-bin9]|nr:hypothetical protein [Tolypothrix sp. Co-bin9]
MDGFPGIKHSRVVPPSGASAYDWEKIITNAQCPMPNAQCPMPNARKIGVLTIEKDT